MRVTLNDIAKKLGVTPSTVQRALNGSEGVGIEKRKQILELASEMGYKKNFFASSLKKGSYKIGLVLPEQSNENRYYATKLQEGCLNCLKDYKDFNFNYLEFFYERKAFSLGEKLFEIFKINNEDLDGIITLGTFEDNYIEALTKFKEKNIPVVLIGTDSNKDYRICCVRSNDEMAGMLAANLFFNFTDLKNNNKIIITGDYSIDDQYFNALGFEKYFIENKFNIEIIKLMNDSKNYSISESLYNSINSNLNIFGIYSCSSRNTVSVCEVISKIGKKNIKIIGNDIFLESANLLKLGLIDAIIHKKPKNQAYTATEILINYITRGKIPLENEILINPIIVLKSNAENYL